MKKIEAIIREEKFDEICALLERSGIGGMTVSEVRGFGHHRNGLKKKIKIEIYADEFQVDKTVELIRKKARSGTTGDGKIAVYTIDQLHRIRTGEEGASAV
jgi:nitrogen regulatory protein P-II 1